MPAMKGMHQSALPFSAHVHSENSMPPMTGILNGGAMPNNMDDPERPGSPYYLGAPEPNFMTEPRS